MAASTKHGPDSDYLRMDREGMVFLCSPDGSSRPIGHVTGPDDACPEELKDEFSARYREFYEGTINMPGERFRLVRRATSYKEAM